MTLSVTQLCSRSFVLLVAILAALMSWTFPALALPANNGWEPNTGQWPDKLRFRTFTRSGASVIDGQGRLIHRVVGAETEVVESLVNSRTSPWQGVQSQPTRVSYYLGNDTRHWRSGLPRFDGLRLAEAYPGIDVLLRLNEGDLERLYELAPGADSERILISLSGSQQSGIDADGVLRLQFKGSKATFDYSAPVAWQDTTQGRKNVGVRWIRRAANRFGFELDDYDRSLPLTIDPVSRTTYFGGSAADSGFGSFVHSNGDVYLVTSTESTDLPGVAGSAQATPGGGRDLAVARLSADLTTLKQVAYFGGSGDEFSINAVELPSGEILLAGSTVSNDLPGTAGGALSTYGGGVLQGDGFVARLSADLGTLLQATYVGGSGDDSLSRVLLSGSNLFLLGATGSSDFPGTTGGAQATRGDMFPTTSDLFVLRMPTTLTSFTQSTYYGGNSIDFGFAMLENANGVYVAGATASSDLAGTAGGAQPALNDVAAEPFDAFAVRFNAGLTSVDQATYFGGSGVESGAAISELGGSLYLSGTTQSSDLPGVSGGAQSTYGGGTPVDEVTDAFVALINADLTSVTQATYLGGSGIEGAFVGARVGSGNLYVSGVTTSPDLPGTAGAAQPDYGGGIDLGDGFVSALSPDLTTLVRSTYIGGSGDEAGAAGFTTNGTLYFSGITNSPDMPAVTGGLQESYGGAGSDNFGDVYVAILSTDLTTIVQGTYFGGNGDDSGGIVLNSSGEVAYIAGDTTSTNLPATAGAAQPAHANSASEDLFVAGISADLAGGGGGNGSNPDPSGPIVSAALPGQRVFTVGGPAVTFFGTIINTGTTPAVECSLALGTPIPATFTYQTTNANNELTGSPNTPVDIAAGGSQSFLFSIAPMATFASTVVTPVYDCTNTDPAPVSPGVNTVEVLSTDVATPDVVAIVLSPTNDGIAHLPGATGSVAVAMATVNVGAAGDISLSADTGSVDLGVQTSVCQTNPGDGSCLAPPASTVSLTVAANATPTFSVFVTGSQVIPLDPANNRLNLRFLAGGTQVGQSSLALQTD